MDDVDRKLCVAGDLKVRNGDRMDGWMDGSERLVIYRGIISMENGIRLKNVIKINYLLNIFLNDHVLHTFF